MLGVSACVVPPAQRLTQRFARFGSRMHARAARAVVPGQAVAIDPRPPEARARQRAATACRRRSAAQRAPRRRGAVGARPRAGATAACPASGRRGAS